MSALEKIIAQFSPISLQEMESVKLMNRTDTKYILTLSQLEDILPKLNETYRVLEVLGNRMSKYETLYYDTPDLQLYHLHQNQKLNRYKIRARNYVESNVSYFEIKFKNNKGRTIKDRIKISKIQKKLEQQEGDLLFNKTGIRYNKIMPQLNVNYYRTTLVSKKSCERVTIDSGLHFIHENKYYGYEQLVIIEVKQEIESSSIIAAVLKEAGIREGSISKYCLGIMSTRKDIKQNNFKKNILRINKLLNV